MGEIFRRKRPAAALEWTGERFVTEIGGNGQIEIEHLHRYFIAREFCRGKHVLDVASGEGYGSAILAQTAAQVIGVELDPASVEHAVNAYRSTNLRYMQGDAVRLPLDDGAVDAVVSFETLEHFFDHSAFLAEVKRVLKPGGFLIISTPDVSVYSGPGTKPNPFHVRELTDTAFADELKTEFQNVSMLRQRVVFGSAILPEAGSSPRDAWIFEQRDADMFQADNRLPRAPYLIAVASDASLPPIGASLYIQADQLPLPLDGAAQAASALQEAIAAREEAAVRLRLVEDAFRAQLTALQEELSRREASLREELGRREASLREELGQREAALDDAQRESESCREQVKSTNRLVQQQELVMRRLQRDLGWRALKEQETVKAAEDLDAALREVEKLAIAHDAARKEIANLAMAYDQICGLIIPVWMRRAVPGTVKKSLRALKRTFRNG